MVQTRLARALCCRQSLPSHLCTRGLSLTAGRNQYSFHPGEGLSTGPTVCNQCPILITTGAQLERKKEKRDKRNSQRNERHRDAINRTLSCWRVAAVQLRHAFIFRKRGCKQPRFRQSRSGVYTHGRERFTKLTINRNNNKHRRRLGAASVPAKVTERFEDSRTPMGRQAWKTSVIGVRSVNHFLGDAPLLTRVQGRL